MSVLHPDNPTTSFGRLPDFANESHVPQRVEPWLISDETALSDDLTLIDSILGLGSLGEPTFVDQTSDNLSTPSNIFLGGRSHQQLRHLCKQVLVQRLPFVGFEFRYWDLAILVPNLLFLLFLLMKCGNMRRKLRHTSSPLFRGFFFLVYATTILNITRCGTSMALSVSNPFGAFVDQILWLSLKFLVLTAELSVLAFGLLLGSLDSARNLRRALFFVVVFSGIHSAMQAILEFKVWDDHFLIESFRIYAHGGMGFWMISSGFFAMLYALACCFPLICCRRVCAPRRCSFHSYCMLMATLNIVQSFGSVLIMLDCPDGMCLADATSFLYFTFYTPLVYFVFLRRSMNSKSFPYRQHKNAPNTDVYQPRFSGLISPSYDDFFDYDRIMQQDSTHLQNILHLNYDFYHAAQDFRDPFGTEIPLMSSRTPDSTITTHMDSDGNIELGDNSTSSESRPIIRPPTLHKHKQLKLGSDGRWSFDTSDQSPDYFSRRRWY
ncbi:unnamed protein product [Bursaphelenchus xylophilus]|uniref:(pine wood nematode) hypothetical protein n=1 Tax=Bursaphelenchus xylophilus TaxID=6326 RepID=A0A1I7RUN1_BURXY|nr:unnamed protein product [Bursaphelenchus xylophilus]CAG9114248.1 unnamed protein product [Bursaphelenchus xylophilus]